jgi:hypothetical protein
VAPDIVARFVYLDETGSSARAAAVNNVIV